MKIDYEKPYWLERVAFGLAVDELMKSMLFSDEERELENRVAYEVALRIKQEAAAIIEAAEDEADLRKSLRLRGLE